MGDGAPSNTHKCDKRLTTCSCFEEKGIAHNSIRFIVVTAVVGFVEWVNGAVHVIGAMSILSHLLCMSCI